MHSLTHQQLETAMSLPLDHIVIAVQDLATTVQDFRQLGFTVTLGGAHPGRSTHNALIAFQDGAYFELIAWQQADPTHPWWPKLQQFGEGIVDFALLPSNTETVVAQALSRGLPYQTPVRGGRLRPDGVQLQWNNARPASADLPFLCGDLTPRTLRVPQGAAQQHANGATGVARLHIATHDLTTSLQRYRALLGDVSVTHLHATQATVQLGPTQLVLETAAHSANASQRLAHQGEGPYAIALFTTRSQAATAATLDGTHGAPLQWISTSGALAPALT